MGKMWKRWGERFEVVTLIFVGGGVCTGTRVDMPISVNTGGRDEVMMT